MERNVAGQYVDFEAIDTTSGNRKVGDAANITPYYRIGNAAAFSALSTTTVTEWAIAKSGTGLYRMEPSQAETNGANITYLALSSTPNVRCIPRFEAMTSVGFSTQSFPANFPLFLIDGGGALGSFVSVNSITSGVMNQIADATLDRVDAIETGWTLRKVMRILFSVLGGKVSGLPGSPVFRSATDAKDRVSATTDSNGNRTAVTLDGT